jgi:hypothetical protein
MEKAGGPGWQSLSHPGSFRSPSWSTSDVSLGQFVNSQSLDTSLQRHLTFVGLQRTPHRKLPVCNVLHGDPKLDDAI